MLHDPYFSRTDSRPSHLLYHRLMEVSNIYLHIFQMFIEVLNLPFRVARLIHESSRVLHIITQPDVIPVTAQSRKRTNSWIDPRGRHWHYCQLFYSTSAAAYHWLKQKLNLLEMQAYVSWTRPLAKQNLKVYTNQTKPAVYMSLLLLLQYLPNAKVSRFAQILCMNVITLSYRWGVVWLI